MSRFRFVSEHQDDDGTKQATASTNPARKDGGGPALPAGGQGRSGHRPPGQPSGLGRLRLGPRGRGHEGDPGHRAGGLDGRWTATAPRPRTGARSGPRSDPAAATMGGSYAG